MPNFFRFRKRRNPEFMNPLKLLCEELRSAPSPLPCKRAPLCPLAIANAMALSPYGGDMFLRGATARWAAPCHPRRGSLIRALGFLSVRPFQGRGTGRRLVVGLTVVGQCSAPLFALRLLLSAWLTSSPAAGASSLFAFHFSLFSSPYLLNMIHSSSCILYFEYFC